MKNFATLVVTGLAYYFSHFSAAAAPFTTQQIVLNGANIDVEFDGHGGLSAGGTSRQLLDYPEKYRNEILDYLFKPGFGAELGVLKLEIGGDTQSTDGTEPSHQHFRGDLGCKRGYEGWLAREAKDRNPDIKIWSLAWGVPGWIGNVSGHAPSYFCADNVAYQVAWIRCLKEQWGVDSDYLGLWNERPQGSVSYVVQLKQALRAAGFGHVGITVEATWQELIRKVLTNQTFNASVAAASKHYPCNTTSQAALDAGKKFWAGEDTIGGVGPAPDGLLRDGNWSGASCWGRKLSQHFVRMKATSVVSWSAVWSATPGVSSNGVTPHPKNYGFLGNAFINATEPWSGHYHVAPVLWMNAHWHQFAKPGWRFLNISADGGSGWLGHATAPTGSYLTLVPPVGPGNRPRTFTLIVETLLGSCGPQGKCNVVPFQHTQLLQFVLSGPLAPTTTLALWCSNVTHVFHRRPDIAVASSRFALAMPPDTICTVTTLLANGTKGAHPTPPPSARPAKHHADNFTTYEADMLARGFSDVYGSFAVRPTTGSFAVRPTTAHAQQMALTQVAASRPTGWAPTNLNPLTLFGDSMWTDVTVNVTAMVNHTAAPGSGSPRLSPPDFTPGGGPIGSVDFTPGGGHIGSVDPPLPTPTSAHVRVCGGCGDTSVHGLSYGCGEGCCVVLHFDGKWTLGRPHDHLNGSLPGFTDTWHRIGLAIEGGTVSAHVDGVELGRVAGACPSAPGFPGRGMVGLGCGSTPYHMCQFRAFEVHAR